MLCPRFWQERVTDKLKDELFSLAHHPAELIGAARTCRSKLKRTDRGFGFGQATIWKIESGQRPVKASELVALADCLGSCPPRVLRPSLTQAGSEQVNDAVNKILDTLRSNFKQA
jgi:hypothetical protein